MAYIKYKEISKYFYFKRVLSKDILPKYVTDYVFEDEEILAAYKTFCDHGIFTTKKIVLFDNYSLFGTKKQIYLIPYDSISTISVIFRGSLVIKFKNLRDIDKLRLRLIYSYITKVLTHQKIKPEEIKDLVEDNISFEKGGK